MAARTLLDGLFRTAIAAAHPAACLPPHLPPAPKSGRLIVLAAGKAAGSMTEVAEAVYSGVAARQIAGVAVARQGYGTRKYMQKKAEQSLSRWEVCKIMRFRLRLDSWFGAAITSGGVSGYAVEVLLK